MPAGYTLRLDPWAPEYEGSIQLPPDEAVRPSGRHRRRAGGLGGDPAGRRPPPEADRLRRRGAPRRAPAARYPRRADGLRPSRLLRRRRRARGRGRARHRRARRPGRRRQRGRDDRPVRGRRSATASPSSSSRSSVADNDPAAPLAGLQAAMRRSEAGLAERLSAEVDVVFQDGPLTFVTAAKGCVVGFVKRLQQPYLDPSAEALLPRLDVGERTPLFLIPGKAPRYSWYQRIAFGRAIESALTGVVRLETPAGRGLAEAVRLADLSAREIPRFASSTTRDPRAPQNLYPIGGLESRLKHLLGDPAAPAARRRGQSPQRGDGVSPHPHRSDASSARRTRCRSSSGWRWTRASTSSSTTWSRSLTALPDGREVRLYGVVDLVRARHEGTRLDSDVFLVETGVLPATVAEAAHVKVTRVEPEIFVPPRPGPAGAPRRGPPARRGALLRRHGAQGADRPLARRRARLREPRLPRRHARGPRQHLRHLRRRDQDELRDVPPPQPVHLRRPRRRDGQHQGARLQREGRGPAVPRPAERAAARGGPRGLREARPARRALRERADARARPPKTRRSGSPTRAAAATASPRSSGRCARSADRAAAALPVRREPTTPAASSATSSTSSRRSSPPRPRRRAGPRTRGSTSRASGSTRSRRSSRRSPTTPTATRASPSAGPAAPRRAPSPRSSAGSTRRAATSAT